MSLLRLSAIGALFIAAITAVVWLSAPWWLTRIAEHELNELGFHEIVIAIDKVGLQQAHISHLHLKQLEGTMEADIRGATLSYNIADLLRLQLDSLTLESLKISLHPAQQPEAALILASPALLFSQIPLRTVNIDQITLRRLDKNRQVLQELTGQASYSGQTIALSMGESGNKQGLQAMLSLDAQGRCSAHIGKGKLQILRAECLLEQQGSLMSIEGKIHTDLAALDAMLIDWIEMPEHHLSGTLQTAWTATLPMNSEHLKQELVFKTDFSLDTKLISNSQPFTAVLEGSVAYKEGKGTWAIADKSQLHFGDRPRFSPLNLTGTFIASEAIHLLLAKGSTLQLQNLHNAELSIPNLNITLARPLQITLSESSGPLLSQPAEIAIHTGKMRWQKNQLQSQSINIKLKAGTLLSPAGSIAINGFKLKTETMASTPALTMLADFDLTRIPLKARGSLSSEDNLLYLDWTMTHTPDKQAGEMIFSLRPVQFAAVKPILTQLYSGAFNVQSGILGGNGRLSWSARLPMHSNIKLEIDRMKGIYQNTTFTGLNATLDIQADKHSMQITSKTLHADSLDAGLPLQNIRMNMIVNYPFKGNLSTQISTLTAETLGGVISSESIHIDTGRSSNPFLVQLKSIDARQLAEFRKQEGLTADGILDGTLPFDWTDKGLKMTSGNLKARSPGGYIRYLGTASMQQMAATDRATRMAMQILSDFRFRLLHISADYQPDGELVLQLQLKGNNPDYENGRPVEFNFNIEENVLKLLQSLRMADEISENIGKKVQKKTRKE